MADKAKAKADTSEDVAEALAEQPALANQFRFIAGRHDEVLKRLADALYANSPNPIANAKAFVDREVAAANVALQQIVQGI